MSPQTGPALLDSNPSSCRNPPGGASQRRLAGGQGHKGAVYAGAFRHVRLLPDV